MPRKPKQIRTSKFDKTIKSHSWADLDQLGLTRDHFYRRFIEIGRCGNCDWEHVNIRWLILDKKKGWEWRCSKCGQIWRSPEITPGYQRQERLEKKVKEKPEKKSHLSIEIILQHK